MYSLSVHVNILIFLIISAFLSYILILFLVNSSLDFPQKRFNRQKNIRWGDSNKSHLGGLAFSICAFLSSLIIIFQNTFVLGEVTQEYKSYIGLVFVIFISSVAGLLDEKENMMPLTKLFFQFIIVAVLLWAGYVIPITSYFIFNILFTIFWVILVINAINMYDNVDGATGLLSIIIFTSILIICLLENANINFIILISVYIGSVLSFLIFNLYPSKIFMGDIGSLQLASVISAVSIKFIWQENISETIIESFYFLILNNIIFLIIFLDVFLVSSYRLINKKSPFIGDTNHLSHAIINILPSPRIAIFLLSGFSLISCFTFFYFNHFLSEIPASNKIFYLIIMIVTLSTFIIFLYLKGLTKKK